ncbi:MAG TPA: phosphoribosylanthranilate isomerase [Woeseiaceae bacterium]|nr:phosphoribosylanthranilate isomerase [Woeseiaceae bacterium]
MKICGLTTADDVSAAVEAGADAVGFVFADSVRKVTPKTAAGISAMVPESVRRVAVMLHPSDAEWQTVLRVFRPDVLQTDAEDFDSLDVPAAVEQWPVYREGGQPPSTDGTYVYEGRKSGRGLTVDWSVAAKLALGGRMMLAGGLHADNVATAVLKVRPYGVDVSSAVESEPGRKDIGLIRKFINAVRAAENSL